MGDRKVLGSEWQGEGGGPEGAQAKEEADDPLRHIRRDLMASLEGKREGTEETLSALSAALLRAIGCAVRLVAVIEPNPRRRSLSLRGRETLTH